MKFVLGALLLALSALMIFQFANAETFKFASVGDVSCSSSAQTVIGQIKSFAPQITTWLGDLSYVDANIDCFVSQTSSSGLGTQYSVIGNHDDSEDGSSHSRDQVIQQYGLGSTGYTSKDFAGGKGLLILMDSQSPMGQGSAQYNFVKSKLQSSNAELKIVAIHKPFLSCTCKHEQNGFFDLYQPIFKSTGVDLILQGHNHNYQGYQPIDGVNYVLVGTGGKSHYALTTTPKATYFKNDVKFGYLQGMADFDTKTLHLDFVDGNGSPQTGSHTEIKFTGSPPPPVEICGNNIDDDGDGLVDEDCPPNPQPPAGTVKVTAVQASTFQDPNVPNNTIDGNTATRWSAEGDNQFIQYAFDKSYNVTKVGIAFYKGDARTAKFEINGQQFTSAGNSQALQNFTINKVATNGIKIIGHANSANLWNSFTEVKFYAEKVVTPPPTEEICGDGIDNNNNGQIDEDCVNEVHACRNETGSCNLAQNVTISIINQTELSPVPYSDEITLKPLTNNSQIFILADRNSTITVIPPN